jgi:hypothetical protein
MTFYANVLQHYSFRKDSQTGFKPEMSTTHQLFIMQHVMDMAEGKNPLYFAFLGKAFMSMPQL